MHRIAAKALRCIRASVAVLVPGCYFLSGLYCLLSNFDWDATVEVGIVHLLIFRAAQRDAEADYKKPLLPFACFVLVGIAIFVIVWISWKPDLGGPIPLALVGSVAWSIVSWECTVYLYFVRAKRNALETASPSITKADQLLVLTAPMIIAGTIGAIYATTDPTALLVSERVADFFHVAIIGVACGLFLAFPWFCLPFALGVFRVFRGHNTDFS